MYSIYAIIILVVAAPIFYFAIQRLYVKEADDTLLLHRKEFTQYSLPTIKETEISTWNRFNRNVEITKGNLIAHDSIYAATFYDSLDAEVEPYRVLEAPMNIAGKAYTYKARTNLVEVEDIIKSILWLFVTIIVFLLFGLFFLTRQLSLNIWKPFYKILNQIENFELDRNTAPRFIETSVQEFNRLNNSLRKLIEKNLTAYQIQREFVENAAHELQTPLAVFQAKIDSFVQKTDVTQEQATLLIGITDSLARLSKLNKNLLLLGKLDSDLYQEKEPLAVSALLYKNLDFFAEQADSKNLKIEINESDKCNIVAHPALVEMLVNNLFLNAIQHNIESGSIEIEVKERYFKISNTSNSKALNKDKLFTRFSKLNAAEKGNGLGLSIVKKIAELNHWEIDYRFEGDSHSFTIKF